MKDILRVAGFEYRRNVLKRSFVLLVFGVPLLFLIFGLLMAFVFVFMINRLPVGYIDRTGLPDSGLVMQDEPVLLEMIPLQSEEEAMAALQNEQIQAYVDIPPDFLQTHQARVVFGNIPAQIMFQKQLDDLLRARLLQKLPPQEALRALEGTRIIVRSIDGQQEMDHQFSETLRMGMLFVGYCFVILFSVFSGYLVKAIADEKENRTIEVLVTSISTGNLLIGKMLGVAGVGITLWAAWGCPVGLLYLLSRRQEVVGVPFPELDWGMLLAIAVLAVAVCVIIFAVNTALGSFVDSGDGMFLGALISMLLVLPGLLENVITLPAWEPFIILLSLAPVTALMMDLTRIVYGIMPAGQLALSVVLQIVYAAAAVWLAIRVVRWGMLRYGQPLTVKGVFRAVWGRVVKTKMRQNA